MRADRQRTIIEVFVVVPPRVLLLDIAGPIEVLRKANLEQTAVRFDVRFVGPVRQVSSSIGLAIAAVPPLPETLPDGALVVVPGSADLTLATGTASEAEEEDAEAEIVAWLARAIRPGIRLATICSGALLAGRAGLLDGVSCTTHHACIENLRRLAPRALVVENRLFVEAGERLSSAGITAGIDLMLHIVAQSVGPACAVAIARYLVIALRRGGADPQLSPWFEGRDHLHPAVHRAQDAVTADPGRPWSVGDLARIAAASPRNLSRLFNRHAGMSVTDYVNGMRIALARDLLTGSRLGIEAVAERTGFASSRQLRRAWGRIHDGPPSRERDRVALD